MKCSTLYLQLHQINLGKVMSETAEGWHRVLTAFEDWIEYETSEFGPWTSYFSLDTLRGLTGNETINWIQKMQDEIIPGRIEKCQDAGVALEDFLPYMPDPKARDTVQSMIDLNSLLQDYMLGMSDIFSTMIEDFKAGGLEEIKDHLSSLAESEEEIRHHMSLYSQGFGKLRSLGLEMPDEME